MLARHSYGLMKSLYYSEDTQVSALPFTEICVVTQVLNSLNVRSIRVLEMLSLSNKTVSDCSAVLPFWLV